MRIMLFLGSGVSIPTGLPSTEEMTRSILEDKWYDFGDLTTYLRGANPNSAFESDNCVPRLQAFLKALGAYSDLYYSTRRAKYKTNYEDLYYLARQVADEENQNIDNPAIEPFLSDIRLRTAPLCGPFGTSDSEFTLRQLGKRACDFIESAVPSLLSSSGKTVEGLSIVCELARSSLVDSLEIFTLNHDRLIERAFGESGIEYSDGFGPPDGEVRPFRPEVYDDASARIKLFKLHGSIIWFRFRPNDKHFGPWYGQPNAPMGNYFSKNAKGGLEYAYEHKCVILIGTNNKIISYNSDIFAEMHCRFHQSLPNHSALAVSGYGWNDLVITSRIMEWLYMKKENRLFLLHRDPDSLLESRSEFGESYKGLARAGKIIPIKKWLCEVSCEDLLESVRDRA